MLAAHPGDRFASKRVLLSGSWDLLTVDASALPELGGDRAVWEHVRLRPFSLLSPRLGNLFQAIAQSLQSDLMEIVRANLRSFLATVASELVDNAPRSRGRRYSAAGATAAGFAADAASAAAFRITARWIGYMSAIVSVIALTTT